MTEVPESSGITIRELESPGEMRQVTALQAEVWGPAVATPSHQLLATLQAGGHVLGALDGDRLVAFLHGFPAFFPGESPWLSSYMLATRPEYRSRGIGRQLKWRQRDWALGRGFTRITWTFDPLDARNCHLALNLLGATATSYVVDYYGELDDEINRGLPSDRLVAQWELDGRRTAEAALGRLALPAGRRVAIAQDFQELRRLDPSKALALRLRIREALEPLLGSGCSVVGYDRRTGELIIQP